MPYFVYGGSKLEREEAPSPDVPHFGESQVILEFLADAYPGARLMPADPFLRVKVRLLFALINNEYIPAFVNLAFNDGPKEAVYDALESLQRLLPASGYLVGDWSIGDAVLIAVYLRLLVLLELKVPTMAPEVAEEALETLRTSKRFARLRGWQELNVSRPSVIKTWDVVSRKDGRSFYK